MHDAGFHKQTLRKESSKETSKEVSKRRYAERQIDHGRQEDSSVSDTQSVVNCFTSFASDGRTVKICSKTVPIQICAAHNGPIINCLAIIDEQSTHKFIDDRLLDMLKVSSYIIKPNRHSLTTLERLNTVVDGSVFTGVCVKGLQSGD